MTFHKKFILKYLKGSKCYLPPPPPTTKYGAFILNPNLPKYNYILIGFKDVSIGQGPEHIVFYDYMKCILRQYGLLHYVTGTINGAMGDTYNCMEILVIEIEKYLHCGIAVS